MRAALLPRLGLTLTAIFALSCQLSPGDLAGSGLDTAATGGSSSTLCCATSTTGGTTSAGDTTGGPEPDLPAPIFDVGTQTTGTTACPGVDLLFVVDDSYSMADEQANLVGSFPGFLQGIQDLVAPGRNVHVGVVTTDAYAFNEPGCTTMGALTTRTGGNDASGQTCGPFAGGRFITNGDDMAAAFSCVAQVGTSGDPKELQVAAALSAFAPELAAPGGCNAGFRRPEAALVLVIISDEEDLEDTPGSPESWYDDLLARTGALPEQVVVLSLIGVDKPNACPEFQWNGSEGAQLAPRLAEFTALFPHGAVGDVCAADYGPFFQEAIAAVASACDDLPAG